jgi:hypothetical protein
MFEQIVIRRSSNTGEIIDLGLLAETLLFYDRVHLLFDNGLLGYLLKQLGGDQVLSLLKLEGVTASVLQEGLGTVDNNKNGSHTYGFGHIRIAAPQKNATSQKKPQQLTDEEWLTLMVQRSLGASHGNRRLAARLFEMVAHADWTDESLREKSLSQIAYEELFDPTYIKEGIDQVLTALLPPGAKPKEYAFEVVRMRDGFKILTNLDFDALNKVYHAVIPPSHSTLSPSYLIHPFLEARAGIFMASKYMSELMTDPASTGVIKVRYLELMRKREKQIQDVDLFQEMHLPEGKLLREVINIGERSFADFLIVLDRARKFKQWLRERNPDQQLLAEYYKAATAESWIDKLGSKTMRWVVTTGLGVAVETFYPTGMAIAATQGLSLLDATLLDRMLKGWRPHQFVKGPLTDFVQGKPIK